MKIEITLRVSTPGGGIHEAEVITLDKPHDQLEAIGLSLVEAKDLLGTIQASIVTAQAVAFSAERTKCTCCRRRLRKKGKFAIAFRTPFGDVPLESSRFYQCACSPGKAGTFSPLTELFTDHVSPELLYLETKWASLVSFGVTVDLLKDVLPIGATLNAETVRNHLQKVATQIDSELGPEHYSFIEGCQWTWEQMPNPEGPIVVGIDGGYVKSREKGQNHFEVMVGKSIPADRPDRYIGLVQSHDKKPRRRLFELLKEQGWQENQEVTFMTDGGDTVRNLARDMSPASDHVLDWFHITMRITVMGQYLKGLIHTNPDEGERLARMLRQIKGFLWNGNLHDGQIIIEDLAADLDEVETNYASIKALRKAANEFQTYIENNASTIPNYAERRRYGERVSTGFVESTVNTVVGKRFCKRQQMRWSKPGAHLMLQTRTRVLDGTLRKKFEQWYPGMKAKETGAEIDRKAA